MRTVTLAERLAAWRYAFRTTNPPAQGIVDPVTRWLVVTRAGLLPITLTSAFLAVLLATPESPDWLNIVLAVFGVVVAHLANNLMNDYADTELGHDTVDYPRALYAPHPILSGLVTKRQLITGIVICQVIDLAIMITLIIRQDWWIAAFALAGLFLSWAYTAPPLRLKQVGLGELDVLVTWGPLMVGGVYYAGVGSLSWAVVGAATVYALLPVSVLMGKHIDKLPYDAPAGTQTLPVLLGSARALAVTRGMMIAYYLGVVALVALRALPWPALLTLLALPLLVRTLRAFRAPRPDKPPKNYPVWPLWWAALAFVHTRRAGGLLLLGLLGWAVWTAIR